MIGLLMAFAVLLLLESVGCESGLVVPNVVHQTYDYQSPNFFLFLSILTIQRYVRPSRHILWVNDEGRYRKMHWSSWQKKAELGSWEFEMAQMIQNKTIEVQLITFPAHPPGNTSTFAPNKAHRSDFVRMQVLWEQGGVYLDTDAFPLRSLVELRAFDFALSFDNIVSGDIAAPKRLNNGVLLARPRADFLRLWIAEYAKFNPASFDFDSSVVPFRLATQYPDLVHVEMHRIAPLSFGFQTAALADALTCGLYHPAKQTVWVPVYDHAAKQYSFAGTAPSGRAARALQKKLVLHLTMSQVRGLCMLRKQLSRPSDLEHMPSFLGHVFREAYYGFDAFDYQAVHRAEAGDQLKRYMHCRDFLGMHTPPDQLQPHERGAPHFRQQYLES